MEKHKNRYRMIYKNSSKKQPQIHSVRYKRLLPIYKENNTDESNNFCRKTSQYNKCELVGTFLF